MRSILFCSEPFEPTRVDPDFAAERDAAAAAGFETALFDHTQATEGDVIRAVRRVPRDAGEIVYRGWMLRATEYDALYRALLARGARLVNDPVEYKLCHHLPESCTVLRGDTPRSIWMPVRGAVDFAAVHERLRVFGAGPIIVKDYVKSQKHHWKEACFIPRADDAAAVERVVRRFLELQGDDLNEGLVFREHVPLRVVGAHPRSGMPLSAEIRTFWLDGRLIVKHAYWDHLGAVPVDPPESWIREIAARVPSRFFTMDVALREDGRWTVIELGDGQVSGLPAPEVAARLYEGLRGT